MLYGVTCLNEVCDKTYVGETCHKLEISAEENSGIEGNSNVAWHPWEHEHGKVTLKDFKILTRQAGNSASSRKIAEAPAVTEELEPTTEYLYTNDVILILHNYKYNLLAS